MVVQDRHKFHSYYCEVLPYYQRVFLLFQSSYRLSLTIFHGFASLLPKPDIGSLGYDDD